MGRSTGFYQNFGLDIQRLGSALFCIQANLSSTYTELANCMSVNSPVAEGYIGWLRHTGLVSQSSTSSGPRSRVEYAVTPFGGQALTYDMELRSQGTLWLLHYYLASEHEERSEAWYVLFNEYLRPGMRFTLEEYRHYFAQTAEARSSNRGAVEKDPQTALNSYTQTKALARLGLLMRDKEGHTAGQGAEAPPLIVGYMLLDWWQRRHPQSNTLRFPQLCQEPGSIGRICLVNEAQVHHWVEVLTGLGYLTFSDSQHQPVNRVYSGSPTELLQRYHTQ